MNNSVLLNKLGQFENNIKEYINAKFEEVLRLQKKTPVDGEFSYDYFMKKESCRDDEILIDEEDAELLIDGILGRYLDWSDEKNHLSVLLNKFDSFAMCR